METLIAVLFLLVLVAFALLDVLEDDEGAELDPLTVARPSIERLDVQAERTLRDLRQLGREREE